MVVVVVLGDVGFFFLEALLASVVGAVVVVSSFQER